MQIYTKYIDHIPGYHNDFFWTLYTTSIIMSISFEHKYTCLSITRWLSMISTQSTDACYGTVKKEYVYKDIKYKNGFVFICK